MTDQELAHKMAKEFRRLFDANTEAMLASLLLTVRRQTFLEAAAGVLLVKDTDAYETSTKDEIIDGLSKYLAVLADMAQVEQ